MASAGVVLLLKIIEENNATKLIEIDPRILHKEEAPVYQYVSKYFTNYKRLPERSLVMKKFRIPEESVLQEGTAEFWGDECNKRKFAMVYDEGSGIITQLVVDGETDKAYQEIMDLAFKLQNVIPHRRNQKTREQILNDNIAQLEKRRMNEGVIGIPFFWSGLSYITHGKLPGNLYVIAARPKVGKTTLFMVDSEFSYDQGKDTLVISMETTEEEYFTRVVALRGKLNSVDVMRGRISTPKIKTLYKDIRSKSSARYFFREGLFTSSIGEIEHLITMLQPQIVYIDGAYLIRLPSSYNKLQRWERITEIVERLKLIAMRMHIPICLSFQFNRSKGRSESADTEHLQYSDAIGMVATAIIGLYSFPENPNMRKIKVVDNRNGPRGEVVAQWDWTKADFTQISTENEAGLVEETETDTIF